MKPVLSLYVNPDPTLKPRAGVCTCDPVPPVGAWGECSVCQCAPRSMVVGSVEAERLWADRRAHEVSARQALNSLHPSQWRAFHAALILEAPAAVEVAVNKVRGLS